MLDYSQSIAYVAVYTYLLTYYMILTWFILASYLSGQYILDNFPWYEYNWSGTILLASHNYKTLGYKISRLKKNQIINYKWIDYKIIRRIVVDPKQYKLGDILRGWITLQTCRQNWEVFILFWEKNVPKKENSN